MTAANLEYVMVRYEKIKYISIDIHDVAAGALHEHGVLEIGLVLEGTVRAASAGGAVEVSQGKLFLFNAYEPHTLCSVSNTPARVLSVWISPHFGREYFARIANTVFDNQAFGLLSPEALKALRQLLLRAAEQYFGEDEAFQLECAGTVSLLLAELFRQLPHQMNTEAENISKKKKQGRMQRIAGYIEKHYKEKLTLSELAKAEGLTTAYMSRVFRELFHMSFQEYLNLLRLERALPLMRDPGVYLVDVCMECGFSDTRYLNAVCQKVFGCNASQYRKRYTGQKQAALAETRRNGNGEAQYNDQDSLQLLQMFRKSNEV